MAENTNIAWTDNTFNPWMGCMKVSEGCKHCYAEDLVTHRMGLKIWGPPETTLRKRTSVSNWKQPTVWNNRAAKTGKREKVFCASLADVFEEHPMLPEIRADLWKLVEQCTNLDWQLLTKRPENVMRMVPQTWHKNWPKHVWIGATVENQEQLHKRVVHLFKVPAPVLFLSMEPLLEEVDLTHAFCTMTQVGPDEWEPDSARLRENGKPVINWAIVGGESGSNARPFDLEWPRNIVAQCHEAGVACFVKQLGDNPIENRRSLKGKFGYKGSDFDSFPEDLRIREFPEVKVQ